MNGAGEGLEGEPHYVEVLQVHFDADADLGDPIVQQCCESEALALLHSLQVIEESRTKRDESAERDADLERLERKLDLVLELLAAQLSRGDAPDAVPVYLSASVVRWPQVHAHVPGTRGRLRLHLHRLLPRPLSLPAEVLSAPAGELHLQFLPLGEACEESLRRHVFLRHRRQLAESRRARSA
jgi:hypothetical protein